MTDTKDERDCEFSPNGQHRWFGESEDPRCMDCDRKPWYISATAEGRRRGSLRPSGPVDANSHDCGKGEWCPAYGTAFGGGAEIAALRRMAKAVSDAYMALDAVTDTAPASANGAYHATLADLYQRLNGKDGLKDRLTIATNKWAGFAQEGTVSR